VGDVVALTVDVVTGDRLPYRDSLDAHLYRVVHEPRNAAGLYECVRVDGRDTMTPCFISAGGMRLADAAERKAAGLPVDEAPPPAESWGASESGRMYGDMSPAPAPTVAPLTVEERRDLINVLWDRMSYNDATVAADAAAEWFAKRGGAK
jgi:hypothetical protein